MSRSSFSRQQQEHAESLFAPAPIAAAVIALTLFTSAQAQTAAAAPAASSADTTNEAPALDAVTVRSRNRIERLQDVPISVSVTTGAELARLDAYGVDAIAKRAANVSWNQGNQRTSSLSIRGIGKIGQTEAMDPSVGVIVDGVSYAYNPLTSSFNFVDIDTIEVARGPQGTLQGKSASVGSITINYKKPSFTPTADYTLAFEKNNGLLGVAAIGGPVIENLLAWRGTFAFERNRGPLVNQYNHDQTYTNTDRVLGRVQLLFTPTDELKIRVEGNVSPRAGEATNGATINRPNVMTTYSNGTAVPTNNTSEAKLARSWFAQNPGYSLANYYAGPDNDAQHDLITGSNGLSAEVNWKLPSGHTITSITGFASYHFYASNDDGTPFDITRNAGGFWNDYHQKSEELRITSPVGSFVDYQAGIYLLQTDLQAAYRKGWGLDAGAWYASPAQYATLNADAAGQILMQDSLANLYMNYNSPAGLQLIDNKSFAGYGQANWHLTDNLSVTTGARLSHEVRRNTTSSSITNQGDAAELDSAALGGFNSGSTGALTGAGVPSNTADQLALANATALKYFKVVTYDALTADQKKQVAAAKGIRAAQIGTVYAPVAAQAYIKNQPSINISPSYKLGPDATTYFSYQHGEKAGIAQTVNGISTLVSPEKTNSFELGLKTVLLDKTLVLNVDAFDTRISDYQQSVRVFDQATYNANIAAGLTPAQSIAYTSATGNVPQVEVKGLEVDGVYAGIANLTLRFSGAYNLARYKRFPNAAQPTENGYSGADPYTDLSGRTMPGAPKVTFNIGGDYRHSLTADKDAHVSANVAYGSSYNSDTALSVYSKVPGSFLTDFAIGAGKHDKTFDVSLVVKNLLNSRVPSVISTTSTTPINPRTYALQFTGSI